MEGITFQKEYRKLIIPISQVALIREIGNFRGIDTESMTQGLQTVYTDEYWAPHGREHIFSLEYYEKEREHYLVNLFHPAMEEEIARLTSTASVRQKPITFIARITPRQRWSVKVIDFAELHSALVTILTSVYEKTEEQIHDMLMPASAIAQQCKAELHARLWTCEGSMITLCIADSPFKETYCEVFNRWKVDSHGTKMIGFSEYPLLQYSPHIELRISIYSGKYLYARERVDHLESLERAFRNQFIH